ncbi:MAG TPA: hypothetical protein VE685_13480 [Thermoanaerobaculia bacterium]|nr:hypothetical protein [Thermoanaerobaculia bacterium]
MSVGTGGTTRLAARGGYEGYRRWLLVFASGAVVFGLMHHADHVIRGNHSGWPFQAEVTPFTFSLLIYALILPGIYLTARGRSVPGYHLFVAAVGLALLGFVHFAPTEDHEAPIRDIYMIYESPLAGMFALVVLAGLIASVTALGAVAIGALRARSRTTQGG